MRSVIQSNSFSDGSAKFNSGQGDSTFTILYDGITFVVDIYGNVISPDGIALDYTHNSPMTGNQSGFSGVVKNFLTVDPSMDSPGSKIW